MSLHGIPALPPEMTLKRIRDVLNAVDRREPIPDGCDREYRYAVRAKRIKTSTGELTDNGRLLLDRINGHLEVLAQDESLNAAASAIVESMSAEHKVDVGRVRNPSIKLRPLPEIRSLIVARLRSELNLSYPRIARIMGMHHHTTAMLAERRFRAMQTETTAA